MLFMPYSTDTRNNIAHAAALFINHYCTDEQAAINLIFNTKKSLDYTDYEYVLHNLESAINFENALQNEEKRQQEFSGKVIQDLHQGGYL